MKTKKLPMRMCTGCREMKPKKELVRVVRPTEGAVAIDRVGKAAGRGAYICYGADCLAKAIKTKALERALETQIDNEVYEALKEELAKRE